MCDLIFSRAFVWNISHFRENSVRYNHKCTQVLEKRTRSSYQILTK